MIPEILKNKFFEALQTGQEILKENVSTKCYLLYYILI